MALQLQRVYLLIAVVGSVSAAVLAQECSDKDNVAVASEELALVQRQASVVLMKQQQPSAGNDAAAGAREESMTAPTDGNDDDDDAAHSEPDTTSWNEDEADEFLEKSMSDIDEDEEDDKDEGDAATTSALVEVQDEPTKNEDGEFPENLLENTSVKPANRILVNRKWTVFKVLSELGDTCAAHHLVDIDSPDACLEAAKTQQPHGFEFTHMKTFSSAPRPYGCVLRSDHKWAAVYVNDKNVGNGAGVWKGCSNQPVSIICFVPHDTDAPTLRRTPKRTTSYVNPSPTSQSPTVNPTQNPTPSPTQSPTASPTSSPTPSPTTLAPTAYPTSSPTTSPTESPTASPTTTSSPTESGYGNPTPSTTPSPTGDGQAIGDPHVTNVHGDTFNVYKVGSMDFLRLPMESSVKDANLTVFGTVKDVVGTSDRCIQSRYITALLFGGAWIGEHRLKVLMQEGEMSVWLGADPVKSSSEEIPIGKMLHLSRSAEDDLRLRAGPMYIDVSAGGNHNGYHYFLNIDAKSLASMNCRVGGLLGEDDHADVSTPPQECQLSSSQPELVTKREATSVASASLAE